MGETCKTCRFWKESVMELVGRLNAKADEIESDVSKENASAWSEIGFMREAATALLALQAENERLKDEAHDAKAAEFWSSLFNDREQFPDGLTPDLIRAELSDYHFLMEQVPKVYMAVTGGKLSKTNYYASTVIEQFEDHTDRLCEEAVEEAKAEAAESKAEGFVMVPVEPTIEMSIAWAEVYYSKIRCIDDHDISDWYAALLAAAAPSDKVVKVESLGKAK